MIHILVQLNKNQYFGFDAPEFVLAVDVDN
jgi:hypothetical protein